MFPRILESLTWQEPGPKGKGGRRVAKRKVTGQNEPKAVDVEQETVDNDQETQDNKQENITSKTNLTYIFKRPVSSALPTVSSWRANPDQKSYDLE